MSCNNEEVLHVGDYGTEFVLTIKKRVSGVDSIVDISSASAAGSKKIMFKDADGTVFERTASFKTDGTDGKIAYTTVSGDIAVSGPLKYRGTVVLSPTQNYQSSTCEIEVYEKWTVSP
jgi:hypothetical protein